MILVDVGGREGDYGVAVRGGDCAGEVCRGGERRVGCRERGAGSRKVSRRWREGKLTASNSPI